MPCEAAPALAHIARRRRAQKKHYGGGGEASAFNTRAQTTTVAARPGPTRSVSASASHALRGPAPSYAYGQPTETRKATRCLRLPPSDWSGDCSLLRTPKPPALTGMHRRISPGALAGTSGAFSLACPDSRVYPPAAVGYAQCRSIGVEWERTIPRRGTSRMVQPKAVMRGSRCSPSLLSVRSDGSSAGRQPTPLRSGVALRA